VTKVEISPAANPLQLPTCKQCGQLMTITRVEPDLINDNGPEKQTFECHECGSEVTLYVPRLP
jgi:hypothetical protein